MSPLPLLSQGQTCPRESGEQESRAKNWIPASAGMTNAVSATVTNYLRDNNGNYVESSETQQSAELSRCIHKKVRLKSLWFLEVF